MHKGSTKRRTKGFPSHHMWDHRPVARCKCQKLALLRHATLQSVAEQVFRIAYNSILVCLRQEAHNNEAPELASPSKHAFHDARWRRANVTLRPWTFRDSAIGTLEEILHRLQWLCNGSRLQRICSNQWIGKQKVQLYRGGTPREMERTTHPIPKGKNCTHHR